MDPAIAAARRTGEAIGGVGLPVYLYGEAAVRRETRTLSGLRRGGLRGLIARAERGLVPDFALSLTTAGSSASGPAAR